VTRIILDFEPPQPEAPEFSSATEDLVYFLSWAFAVRYGASHEAAKAAVILRNELGIDLKPLLTFADREVEDPADAETLEQAWQDAAPLATCCKAVTGALARDEPALEGLRAEFPLLRQNVADLGEIAAWSATRGVRIRVTYELT
jgi:hypothetical protein